MSGKIKLFIGVPKWMRILLVESISSGKAHETTVEENRIMMHKKRKRLWFTVVNLIRLWERL